MIEKYDLMTLILHRYRASGMIDPEFAVLASEKFETTISASTIRHYREGLGVKAAVSKPALELRSRIAELERQLDVAKLVKVAHPAPEPELEAAKAP